MVEGAEAGAGQPGSVSCLESSELDFLLPPLNHSQHHLTYLYKAIILIACAEQHIIQDCYTMGQVMVVGYHYASFIMNI